MNPYKLTTMLIDRIVETTTTELRRKHYESQQAMSRSLVKETVRANDALRDLDTVRAKAHDSQKSLDAATSELIACRKRTEAAHQRWLAAPELDH